MNTSHDTLFLSIKYHLGAVFAGCVLMTALPAAASPPNQTLSEQELCLSQGKVISSGKASWYGPGFKGKTTASGEKFNPYEMAAAHRVLPMGRRVVVTNTENGESRLLEINDRGPYIKGRVIDVTLAAANALGFKKQGVTRVEVTACPLWVGPPGRKPPLPTPAN